MPLLPVPQISQWGVSASLRRTDCGAACVAMLLEYYGKRGKLTVDQLALETTLATADVGLRPEQLVTLAGKHGLSLLTHIGTTLAQIRSEIDAGRPVIALIAYRFILSRLDQGDNKPGSDGHFITLVGYDDTHFVADDPDYWYPYVERGHNVLIPITELDQAINGIGAYRKCVFVDRMESMVNVAQIKQAIAQATATLAQASAMLDELAPGDPPDLPPVAVTKYVNVASGLLNINVRGDPSTKGGAIGTIPRSTAVNVIPTSNPDWMQLADGGYKGGYLFASLLSDARP